MCPGCPAGTWAAAGRHPTPVEASTSVVVEVDVGPRYKACLLHNLTPPCAAGNRPNSYVAHTNGCTPQSGGCPGRRSPLPPLSCKHAHKRQARPAANLGLVYTLHACALCRVSQSGGWWMSSVSTAAGSGTSRLFCACWNAVLARFGFPGTWRNLVLRRTARTGRGTGERAAHRLQAWAVS